MITDVLGSQYCLFSPSCSSISLFLLSFRLLECSTGNSTQRNKARKRKKRHVDWKGRNNTSAYNTDNTIVITLNIGREEEKLDYSHIADGNVKWYHCSREQFGSFP